MSIHHPQLTNQFYKVELSDTPGSTTLVKAGRWNHIHATSSGNVINWDSKLCMAAGGATLLDAHTGGQSRTSPGRVHDNQYDQDGGIGVDDVKVSLSRGWGQTIYVPDDYDWADVIYAVRSQRRYCLIGVEYGMVPYSYQAQKGGDFPHAMGIDFVNSDGAIRVYDSLATNPQYMPQSAIRGAAEKLALEQRGTRGRLFVAFSRSRPLLETEPLYRVQIVASIPLYDKPYGSVKGHVTTATYTCTRHKVNAQWWYQILPTAKTANRGLWISPSRRTRITPL